MGIIAAGQITVVDLSDAPVLNAFITASRPTTQTYSKDSKNYNPSYASTPQVLTLNVTKAGSTTSIIGSISGLHWFVVDGSVKTEITSKVNTSNEYISGTYNENLTTKLNIDTTKGYRRYEATGVWRDPSTDLDVQFSANIDLLLTQNGATGPQGPQGDDGPQGPQGETGNGIANTVVTYGLSMTDTTEPATWSSERPALVKGMYLWTRTVIIYTNGESTTSYQISYIPKDGDATGEINKTKQELLEKLETVRDDSLTAVEEAKQQLVTVRDESLAAAEEAKQQVTTVANDLSKAKTDFQNAVNAVDTKATNVQNDLSQAKQDLASQAQQLREQANAQSELTNRVSSVEETANGTKTTVSELSKTVDQNGKNITSVTARTKVVEDDLAGTKTTLSQVKMTADSTSQKTATLETGLDGLSAKFENLSVGNKNYLPTSRVVNRGCSNFSYSNTSKIWTMTVPANSSTFGYGITFNTVGLNILLNGGETLFFGLMIKVNKACSFNYDVNNALSGTTSNDNDDTSKRVHSPSNKNIPANVWTRVWFSYTAKANVPITENNSNFGIVNNTEPVTVEIKEVMVAKSNMPVDYQTPDTDIEQKIAEYKQNADQNYASLQTTVQNLDGTVQHNKTVADQTAQGFTTRIESLETYKDGESTRANQYFELAKTETARQLSVERTAIAKDYVAKSTYTSDVTGIRNELSATTTTANTIKTNLANYQATNDRAVASLQSSMQTANGDISSLKTKVEAVPGQITSAVSAVESKIPIGADGRNLWIQSKATGDFVEETLPDNHITGQKKCYRITNNNQISFNIEPDFSSRLYRKVTFSAWVKYENVVQGPNNWNVFNCFKHSLYRKNSSTGTTTSADYLTLSGFSGTSDWKYITYTYDYAANKSYDQLKTSIRFNIESAKSGTAWVTGIKIELGSILSDYSPAPEDTVDQITSLSSQIKQTADGITLLATKTELNTAKNELQSGIKTATDKANNNAQTISNHTTQISALNTGLNAKVSQSDFNTLSGRVTTAENNIIAKANELSSKITSVEGKIPKSVGVRNLLIKTNQGKNYWAWSVSSGGTTAEDYNVDGVNAVKLTRTSDSSVTWHYIRYDGLLRKLIKPNTKYTLSFDVKPSVDVTFWAALKRGDSGAPLTNGAEMNKATANQWTKVSCILTSTSTLSDDLSQIVYLSGMPVSNGNWLIIKNIKLEEGVVSSDWQPAPEDAINQISSLSSELKQTQNGITLLATKTELNTAKNELQSGIKTATDKANNNAQTISNHTTQISALNTGLNAKVSQSDFNTLSGRVTTAENNIIAKANELSSKITSVEGKIPTSVGGTNLLLYTADPWNAPNDYYQFVGATKTDEKLNGSVVYKTNVSWNCLRWNGGKHLIDRKNIKVGDELTYSIYAKTDQNSIQTMLFARYSGQSNAEALSGGITLTKEWKKLSVTFKVTSKMVANNTKLTWVGFEQTTNCESGKYVYYACNKLERGNISTDYDQAPEDAINKISSLSSEFKQTTDSIKASVQSLDNNTVKNSSLTINADGIVMKAGKSTTDVANAIGSYFAVNQNAINLFSDKINVKGNMIVSGSISSDKIAASGITANVIKGGTLQSTNGSTNFELNTGKLFYNNNNTGVFRVQNGASTMGLKFSNTSVTVNGTSRILSRAIMGGDRRQTTLDDGKWDQGGFTGIVAETINGVGADAHESADALRVIGDNIYFTHTYNRDTFTNTSAAGWKMETYAPYSTYTSTVVLKPYGINYRNSNIVVGDVRLDNGDGSGYWVRNIVRSLKTCFGHILNGGTSSQALNAIRSELNNISGV